MRVRSAFVAGALGALAPIAAGCTALRDGGATPVGFAPTTAPSSSVWVLPASLQATEWERVPTAKKLVALTFDAGSGDQGVAKILSTLTEKNVTATFFLTGAWAEKFPAEARTIASFYPVGNHTYSHADLPKLADGQVAAEVKDGARAIRETTQTHPRPLFRFPNGSRDARTIRIVNELGYGSIRWSVDTLGWKGVTGGQSLESVRSRILAGLQPGEIVLMHVGAANDGTTLDADALAGVIDAIRAQGYGFTDVYRFAARYANVADDASGRFSAPSGWKTSTSSAKRYGATSHQSSPSATGNPAEFRVHAPQSARYRVFAWWPVSASYNQAATILVATSDGSRAFTVDQHANGGRWVQLGTVPLQVGDHWSVRVLRSSSRAGPILADAFRLTSITPP